MIPRPHHLRRRRASSRGFTLIEISVALIAGLVVSLAVVGFSKEATNTFHEESRASMAEAGLRIAMDRIRNDLARVSFMSSPNISVPDPTLASGYTVPGAGQIFRMRGIRLYDGGSTKTTVATGFGATTTVQGTDDVLAPGLSATNGLSPDLVDMMGNYTTADSYTLAGIQFGQSACQSGGDRLLIAGYSAAGYRLQAPGALDAAFVPGFLPSDTNKAGIVRIVDDAGRTQYAVACGTGVNGATPAQPYVDLQAPVVVASSGAAGGLKGLAAGRGTINPVATVRWRLAPRLPAYATLDTAVADTARFDLYRGFVDATGVERGTPELIAEYATDLKLAFSVDPGTAAAPTLTTYAFDVATSSTTAPQRIRSVRVRLATRTSIPDRTRVLSTPAGTPYLFRYCTLPVGIAGLPTCPQLGRVRTAITEVALQNQARVWW